MLCFEKQKFCRRKEGYGSGIIETRLCESDKFKYHFSPKKGMNEKIAEKYVLLIVIVVATLAVITLLSSVLTNEGSVTGAAVRGQIETLCKDSDGSNAERKGSVSVFYGSQFPDQCYDDKAASEDPVNNGRYLRETVCKNNEASYNVYDCGKNKCQYGACVGMGYTLIK